MKIRWTPRALRDLESIHSYIAPENPDAAMVTVQKVYESVASLEKHPYIGRKGRLPGARELVIPPYIVSYRIRHGSVELHGIAHSSRQWE